MLPVLLALYLGLTLVGMDRYPAVWVDEPWIAEPAWVLAAGDPLGSPSCGERFRFADRLYWMPPLHFTALAGVYAAGFPPLLGGRWLSALAGAATLLLLLQWAGGVLAEPWEPRPHDSPGPGTASARRRAWLLIGIAVAFTADPMLWKAHRTIRPEAMLTLWSVLAVSAAWNPERRLRGMLAGAATALALLTHPNGILTAVAVAGVLVLRRAVDSRVRRDLLSAAGAFVLLCLPTALYFLEDRAGGFASVIGQNAPHFHGEGSAPIWIQWWREHLRYRMYFGWPYLVLPLLLWAATLAAAVRMRAGAALGWVVGAYLAGLACMPNKSELYLTLPAPFVYLLAARVGMRMRPRLAAALGALWLANLLLSDAALLRRNRACDYEAWSRPLAAAVPAGAGVAGSFLAWLPFRDHPFYSVSRVRAGDLHEARPEYLVWSEDLTQGPQFARLRRELAPFLAEHAEVLLRIESACYGTAVLYRPRWDEANAANWERYGLDDAAPAMHPSAPAKSPIPR